MLWFTLNITCSIMLSASEKASLQYPNIRANWFKALLFSDAVDMCFTFIQLLGNGIYLTAAYALSSLRHHNIMPTLTPARALVI